LTRTEIAKYIDHSLLLPTATQIDIDQLCDEAIEHGFPIVTMNPVWVSYCVQRLQGTQVGVNSVVGFPLGATTAFVKVETTREAIRNGAAEIDMVINVGALKSGYPEFVEHEIEAVVQAAGDVPVKVILETCYLTDEEKVSVCNLCMEAKAAFVKTSTGFGTAGAIIEDVKMMRNTVGGTLGVKASGGIKNYSDALAMIEAGASRLGTSNGVAILNDCPS
jgi:deoxyribose-phosphate aldolase